MLCEHILDKMTQLVCMMTKIKTFLELSRIPDFESRFDYLKLGGHVGHSTFGFDRYINQKFYASWEWKNIRQRVIIRDGGCDLGVPGYEINGQLLIHHINPLEVDDIIHGEEWILNPNYLITTTHNTHNAIHYGDRSLLRVPFVERKPGDTRLWQIERGLYEGSRATKRIFTRISTTRS